MGTIKARRVGTSLGVLIPAFIADDLGIQAGTLLNMDIIDKKIVIQLKYPERKTQLDYINEVIARGITEDLEV